MCTCVCLSVSTNFNCTLPKLLQLLDLRSPETDLNPIKDSCPSPNPLAQPSDKMAETYAGRIAAVLLRRRYCETDTHGETDKKTPDRCFTLFAIDVTTGI